MGITALKKELRDFSADQLRDLIYELYSVRALTPRQYLDHFINPDEEKVVEQLTKEFMKALTKVRRGRPRFTATQMTDIMHRLADYDLSPALEGNFRLNMLAAYVALMCGYEFNKTQRNVVTRLLSSTMDFGQSNELGPEFHSAIGRSLTPQHYVWNNRDFFAELKTLYAEYQPPIH